MLYPVFAHCYLALLLRGHDDGAARFFAEHWRDHAEDHRGDVELLRAVASAAHLEHSEYATNLRSVCVLL